MKFHFYKLFIRNDLWLFLPRQSVVLARIVRSG